MKFKSKIKDIDKPKKTRVKRTGTKRPLVIALWGLLIVSVVFGIYNNINSVTKVINNETVVTVEKVKDTSGVWVFVRNFIWQYYTWDNSKGRIAARAEAVNAYLTPELQELNKDAVREDIPVKSSVSDMQVWSIDYVTDSAVDYSEYDVVYSVTQAITDGDGTDKVTSCYIVRVHEDADGSMVIIKNPTICAAPGKSDYQPEAIASDGSVDAGTRAEALEFLESFFALYPGATNQELSYYVRDNCLEHVEGDYIFAEIVNPLMVMEDDNIIRVSLAVKYLDNATKMAQISQYDLGLSKVNGNWVIVRSD